MKDKRKYVRLEQNLPLTFERKSPQGVTRGRGTTRNVSAEGLCFTSAHPLGVGEKITVTMTLPPHSHLVCLEGRVIWVEPPPASSAASYEIGVQIAQVANVDHHQFLLFVCSLMCEELVRRAIS